MSELKAGIVMGSANPRNREALKAAGMLPADKPKKEKKEEKKDRKADKPRQN